MMNCLRSMIWLVCIGSSGTKEVPRTVDRMDKAFSSAEKLAIHLAVLERSNAVRQQGTSSMPDLEFDQGALLKKDEPAGPKSRMEILAELRDYKRRRQSYRAKNVHITRRSQTEIMREVIEVQMKELQQALQGDEGSVQSSQHEECPSNLEGKRSRDTSRSPVRSRSRQDDGLNDQHKNRRSTNRSRYDDEAGYPLGRAEARSRDPSPRPGPTGSRHDRDRNVRRRSNNGSASPLIKVEKVEPVAPRESGSSTGVLELGRDEASTSRSSTPHAVSVISVKVESESRSPSPSRARRDERDGEDRSRRHSKHKHRHKHRHHSRDSR